MAEKKRGFMTRLIEGSEKSESYARSTLPSNRWELFWDIFKGRFSKLFIINLMVLVFLIPLFLLMFLHSAFLSQQAGLQPFSQNLLVGYPAVPDITGVAEFITMQVNLYFYALLPIVALLFSVGLAGGFYVIRNMVWTEGLFVSNDFWRGIRLNYFIILKIAIFYTVVLFLCTFSLSSIDYLSAMRAAPAWILTIGKGSTYVFIFFTTLMALFMCSMGVTYELSFFKLLKNSFYMTLGLLPTNILFAAAAAIPLLLYLIGGILTSLALMLILTFGISYALLVWTNYSQWVFDRFINDKVEGAVKNRGIYEKTTDKSQSAAVKQYKMQVEQLSKSSLSSRPIKPITDKDITLAELPSNYGRKHLEMLKESKVKMIKDNEEYIEKHKSQPKYSENQAEDEK